MLENESKQIEVSSFTAVKVKRGKFPRIHLTYSVQLSLYYLPVIM